MSSRTLTAETPLKTYTQPSARGMKAQVQVSQCRLRLQSTQVCASQRPSLSLKWSEKSSKEGASRRAAPSSDTCNLIKRSDREPWKSVSSPSSSLWWSSRCSKVWSIAPPSCSLKSAKSKSAQSISRLLQPTAPASSTRTTTPTPLTRSRTNWSSRTRSPPRCLLQQRRQAAQQN